MSRGQPRASAYAESPWKDCRIVSLTRRILETALERALRRNVCDSANFGRDVARRRSYSLRRQTLLPCFLRYGVQHVPSDLRRPTSLVLRKCRGRLPESVAGL